jgi:hypothetical protein
MFLPQGGGSISCVTTGKITVLFVLIFAFYARDEKANDSELSGSNIPSVQSSLKFSVAAIFICYCHYVIAAFTCGRELLNKQSDS